MRKIMMIAVDLGYGGAPKIFSSIVNYLSQDNIVHVYYFGKKPIFYELDTKIKLVCPFAILNRITLLSACKHLRKQNRIEKYDYSLGFDFYSRILSLAVSIFSKTKSIVSERNDPNHYSYLSKIANRWIYRNSDIVVFQTEEAKLFFCKKIQYKAVIIPNFIEKPCISFQSKADLNKVIYVGRISFVQKAQDVLIRSFKRVVESIPDAILNIYGDGPDISQAIQLVSDLNLSNNILFKGVTSDLMEIYSDAKVFVFTSRYEGMPNAIMEAMTYKVPIITTDCSPGGARALIDSGHEGIIVDVDDHEAISSAIIKLLNDDGLRVYLAENAYKKIDLFSPSLVLKMWGKIFV